jgi:hypothetical protein
VSQQRLDQLEIGLDPLQQLGFIQQFGNAASLDEFSLHDFASLPRKQFRDSVHPFRYIHGMTWPDAACPILTLPAMGSAAVIAAPLPRTSLFK